MERMCSKGQAGQPSAEWNQAFAAQVQPMAFRSATRAPFSAALTATMLGSLRLARMSTSDVAVERATDDRERWTSPTFLLVLQLAGRTEVAHYGNVASLAEGDMVLCDGGAPLRLRVDGQGDLLFLRVPAATLKEHLPSPECCCGRLLRGGEGLTATAAMMAVSLFDQLEAGLALHYQDRVARHLLDVVATAYALAIPTPDARSSVVSARCATVKLFIEQHLRDPDLTPCSIAERMKLSPRYLRMIFASENETVSAYILRRRLEQCARQIADPAWRGHSMIEIAFGWGFNSAPHFTRTFRDRYAMPPRDYRRLKLAEGAPPFLPPTARQGRSTHPDARAA